jgi:hypothetical protein
LEVIGKVRIKMESRLTNANLSLDVNYKLFFYFGLFFLIACGLTFKSERTTHIPTFDKLFITEGTLKFPAYQNRRLPSIFIQSIDNRMIKLSTYRGYGIHKLRKFKDGKIKVWWYSNNLKKIYSPNHINSLYQAEVDGQIIVKYDDEKKLIESRPKYKDTIFLALISFVFLLLALLGYINKLDSKKSPKL